MTAASVSGASTSGNSRFAEVLSVAWVAKLVVPFCYSLYAVSKIGGLLLAAGALAVADTWIGGKCLEVMFSSPGTMDGRTTGWALSLATSGVLMTLWGFIFAKKRLAWLLGVPAVVVMLVDVLVDARYPTLKQYGRDVFTDSGILPPHYNFTWELKEALVVSVTLFNEPLIMMIFMLLFMEIKKMTASPASRLAIT